MSLYLQRFLDRFLRTMGTAYILVLVSSCGAGPLTGIDRSTVDQRGPEDGSLELSGKNGSKTSSGVGSQTAGCAFLTPSYGSSKNSPYGGHGGKTCPKAPVPPPSEPPLSPGSTPPAPPLPTGEPKVHFPLSLLTGLVCQKDVKQLYNLAQFVGTQSKDQFQYLINAGVSGDLSIDQMVLFGSIAKSLTETQIAEWKTRVCVGSVPHPSCKLPDSIGKGSNPDLSDQGLAKCLPKPPSGGTIPEIPAEELKPLPGLDDSGKSST